MNLSVAQAAYDAPQLLVFSPGDATVFAPYSRLL
jgi:hypothetical protein